MRRDKVLGPDGWQKQYTYWEKEDYS
jgi:hypothetical protein